MEEEEDKLQVSEDRAKKKILDHRTIKLVSNLAYYAFILMLKLIHLYITKDTPTLTHKLVCKAAASKARFIVQLPFCRLARIITNWKEPGWIFMAYFRG